MPPQRIRPRRNASTRGPDEQLRRRGKRLHRNPPAAALSAEVGQGAPAYSRFVNRRAGGYLAVLAYRVGATPNQVTAVSALCTFAGITGLLLLPPSWPLGVAVSLALVLGYALDSADGQLARLRGTSSVSGEWLDHVIDSAKIATLHVAVLVSAFRFSELPTAWLLVPIAYGAVESVMFFAMILNDQLRRVHRATTGTPAPEPGRPPRCARCSSCRPTTGCCAWCSCCLARPSRSPQATGCSSRATPCSWRRRCRSGSPT
ncbi:CDP-alcohol phosphatidyltransferase family protein [Saccharopolyspora spinosporotrichia]